MTEELAHFIVEEGPEKGRSITLPSNDVRIGRSSNNDVVIRDPVMSRFHCRIYFKPGEGLWALDLGSSNQTLINDTPLLEQKINIGDRITMGDTVLKVVSDTPAGMNSSTRLFDDPLSPPKGSSTRQKIAVTASGIWPGFAAIVLILALLAAIVGIFWIIQQQPIEEQQSTSATRAEQPMELVYEKINAGPENIMRYAMEIKDNKLSIQIDDLKNNRHVPKNQNKELDEQLIRNLRDSIETAGFFDLKSEYRGIAQDVWDVLDLSITIGRKTHRVKAINSIPPPAFTVICELIEEFGQNELGLSAISLSPDQLIEMAKESFYLGQNLFDKKEVKHENLYYAIDALKKSEWYVETLEPKPEFYPDIVALRGKAEEELEKQCDHHNFMANRAIKLGEWEEAAQELRIIREKIPNRTHPRHQEAVKRLIDVERRLK